MHGHKRHIQELDGLRCFAILAVIAVHFQLPKDQGPQSLIGAGWIGVDLFFVISGYLITTILLRMKGSPHPYRTFYWRRSLRIFPLYYVLLAVIALCMGSALSISRHAFFLTSLDSRPFHTMWLHIAQHAPFVPGGAVSQKHLFSGAAEGLGMVWSLSVEELFYLCWAPVILHCSRRMIIICTALPITLCPILRVLAHTTEGREYFGFIFRIDALMFGACVAFLMLAMEQGLIRSRVVDRITSIALPSALTLLLILWCWKGFLPHVEVRSTYTFALVGYTLVGILAASVVTWCDRRSGDHQVAARILRHPVVTYVGRISYGLYLIHILAFVFVLRVVQHFYGPKWIPGYSVIVAAVLLTFSLAALSWRYFETPILRYKDSFFRQTSARTNLSVSASSSSERKLESV